MGCNQEKGPWHSDESFSKPLPRPSPHLVAPEREDLVVPKFEGPQYRRQNIVILSRKIPRMRGHHHLHTGVKPRWLRLFELAIFILSVYRRARNWVSPSIQTLRFGRAGFKVSELGRGLGKPNGP